MQQTAIVMGMPITIEIVGFKAAKKLVADTFAFFRSIDARFSTYKSNSEISRINRGLPETEWSTEMKTVLDLCEQTKRETGGYFDIRHDGKLDPSGLVKGWAIQRAAERLKKHGASNFYIDAGGDIQISGVNSDGQPWKIGIRSPFNLQEIVKTITISDKGVATSGTYIRGQHVYNPRDHSQVLEEIKSITVIGPNIFDADRFATAAFAMGRRGVHFIESLLGFEAYMIDKNKFATFTSGFEGYVVNA